MDLLPYLLAAIFGLMLAVQLAFRWYGRRLQGKLVPALGGDRDRLVREHGRLLLYFFSPHCGQCRAMTAIVQRLSENHPNVVLLDVSQEQEVMRRFGIVATPTTVLVVGGQVRRVLLGVQPERVLEGCVGNVACR
jgi:thioredoxin 1